MLGLAGGSPHAAPPAPHGGLHLRLCTACFRGGEKGGDEQGGGRRQVAVASREAASREEGGGRRQETGNRREKEGDREKKERGGNANKWAYLRVASMSAKPPCKIVK